MANDPAFLFYPGDYLRDTQCLSEKAQVAYDRIMCEHMRNICTDMSNIVISKERVNFFTKRLSEDEREEIFHVLEKTPKGYQIKWVADSIAKRKSYTDSRSKNRSSKKEKQPKNISKTYVPHMENENENTNEIKDKEGIREKKEIFSILNYEIDEILVESKAMQKQVSKEKILGAWKEFQSINAEEKFDGPTHAKRMFSIWIDKKKLTESDDKTHNHGQRQSKPRNFN